jgi:hypothetical protein
MRWSVMAGLFLALGASAGSGLVGAPRVASAAEAESDLRILSTEQIRARLRALDAEHTAALEVENYDQASRILREINRLGDELIRREFRPPPQRPPDLPIPRR